MGPGSAGLLLVLHEIFQLRDGTFVGFLHQQTLGGHADPTVRMFERFDLIGGAGEGSLRKLLSLLVLNAPDAAEVMIAIGADGGVPGAVLRPAGVIVDRG